MTTDLPVREFIWTQQDGTPIAVSEMKTTHLFYALRMIWNHTVPPPFQLPGGRYNGPQNWSVKKRREAVRAFLVELSHRDDLPVSLDIQLGIMRDTARTLNMIQIERYAP